MRSAYVLEWNEVCQLTLFLIVTCSSGMNVIPTLLIRSMIEDSAVGVLPI